MFTLTIETDNAAFDGDQHSEIARILRRLADTIASDGRGNGESHGGTLRDINGALVGAWHVDARDGDGID